MSTPTIDIDTLARPTWTEQERANAALIADFVRLVMNEHDFDGARTRFGANDYVQHSRGIPDGMANLLSYLADITKRFPEYSYDVKRIQVDGDLVTFHSHATMKRSHRGDESKGLNIIDTWRVADGEIAEHWDAIQPLGFDMRLFSLVTGGKTKHDNSVF